MGYGKIPQAAIDAADRLIDRVIEGRHQQLAMDKLEREGAEKVESMIQEQLRPSMEIMKWRSEHLSTGKKITEWPPGTIFTDSSEDSDK